VAKVYHDSGKLTPTNYAATLHDDLQIPGGRKIAECNNSELVSILTRAKVPGVTNNQGRAQNLEAYAAYLNGMGEAAGRAAIKGWLGSYKNVR
jgi:hypothetical protein